MEGKVVKLPLRLSVPLFSLPYLLSFLLLLSFGLSTLVSSSVSSFSAESLFLSLISFSSISRLFTILFSLSIYVFFLNHLLLLLSFFPILSHWLLSVCLSVSPLPLSHPNSEVAEEGMHTGFTDPQLPKGHSQASCPFLQPLAV